MPVFLDGKGRYHRYFLTCKDGIFRRELFRFDGKAVFFFLTGRHGPFFFGGNVFAGRDHEQKKKRWQNHLPLTYTRFVRLYRSVNLNLD